MDCMPGEAMTYGESKTPSPINKHKMPLMSNSLLLLVRASAALLALWVRGRWVGEDGSGIQVGSVAPSPWEGEVAGSIQAIETRRLAFF